MDLIELLSSCANDARNEKDAMIIMQAVRRIIELEQQLAKMETMLLFTRAERDSLQKQLAAAKDE